MGKFKDSNRRQWGRGDSPVGCRERDRRTARPDADGSRPEVVENPANPLPATVATPG